MNPLRAVNVVYKSSDAQLRGDQVWVLDQGDFFFLDRADHSLGIAVLFGVPDSLEKILSSLAYAACRFFFNDQ
jgi:hypothetical protein